MREGDSCNVKACSNAGTMTMTPTPTISTVAMTGDFVIRIAQGTTVARGDLMMSAGDGTALTSQNWCHC